MSVARAGLPAFNTMDHQEACRRLRACLDVPRWADDVASGRPYDGIDQVEAAMAAASTTITDAELDQALARHPRIGERADPATHDADHSTREQAGIDPGDAGLAERLAEGNRAYEQRFGRVFIVRAAGRSGQEVLDHLRHRLANTEELERAATIDQLTQIAMLRIREVLA